MSTINQIDEDIEFHNTVIDVITAYEESYIRKLQNIRNRVLKTREFVIDLSEMFTELRRIKEHFPTKEVNGRTSKSDPESSQVKALPHGSVAVLLAGSRVFSGTINQSVFKVFEDHINNNSTDIVIIGKIGRDLYKEHKLIKPFKYYDIPERTITKKNLSMLIEHLSQYKNVNIFFGKFLNIIDQTATQSNISGNLPFKGDHKISTTSKEPDIPTYLFEPSLDSIISFFESQIFKSLFKQTINESYLAQIGSRINTLEDASSRTATKLDQLLFIQQKNVRTKKNKEQLQTLTGMSFWFDNL